MNKKTLLLSALLIAGGVAHAADWVSIATNDDGMEDFIDATSIRVDASIRRAWVKSVYKPQTKRGYGSESDKWVSHFVHREAVNCKQETSRTEASNWYFEDGTNFPVLYDGSEPWVPVAPETMNEARLKWICSFPVLKPSAPTSPSQ